MIDKSTVEKISDLIGNALHDGCLNDYIVDHLSDEEMVKYKEKITRFEIAWIIRHMETMADIYGSSAIVDFERDIPNSLTYQGKTYRVLLED